MIEQPKTVPREAITGIATGLVMMAVFTTIWSCIANAGLSGKDYHLVLIAFCLVAATFAGYGIFLFSNAKNFPKSTSEADLAEKKRTGKWFGIIFGAEGLGIAIAVNVVINLGHPDLTIPTIALVVGLHFYPMAKVFKRNVDYYLATWTTIIAICGIVFILNKTFTEEQAFAFVGIGTAIATSCYGLYMIYRGQRFMKPVL